MSKTTKKRKVTVAKIGPGFYVGLKEMLEQASLPGRLFLEPSKEDSQILTL